MGLTAPFVFRAEGRAGGSIYVLHSAATSADVGGTINITPLTDLVLANVAG
ncbi:MAG: cytochrome c, partial [Sphingobacteriales bacterium]